MVSTTGAAGAAGFWISWKVEAAVVLVFVLCLVWFWPGIAARLRVQTSALACPPPAEHEQLHIIVRLRNGRLAVDECLYVGSQGTYRRAGR